MRKTYLVAWREFRERVTSRAFLLGAIGTPIIVLVLWLTTGGFDVGPPEEPPLQQLQKEQQERPIGYVDRAGLIERIPQPLPADAFRAYDDVEAAQVALDREEIAAYYVVPEDYRETGEIERVSPRIPTALPDEGAFDWVLVSNLHPAWGPEQIPRLRWPFHGVGPTFVSVRAEEVGVGAETDGTEEMMLPFVVSFVVMMPLFVGGGYLFQSLTNEKESRVMEVLLVSLRPRQLLIGKLLGLSALVLVQYLIWVGIAVVAVTVLGQGLGELLAAIHLSGREVLLALPYALGGFGLYAGLMAGMGALAADVESSRGWTFVLTLPMLVPFYVGSALIQAPHGALALVLSLFPYSAPVGMLMRMTVTAVPAWQFAVSLGLLMVTAVGTIWVMARLFRAQTLLSGESFSPKRFWSALTAR